MALADKIPLPSAFTDLLSGLIGDEGSGLSGILATLRANDVSELSGTFLTELRGLLGVELQVDTTELIQAPLAALQQLLASIPSDPSEVTSDMIEGLTALQQTFADDVLGGFGQLLDRLADIEDLIGQSPETLIPFDPASILDETTLTILTFLTLVKEKAEALSDGFLDINDGDYSLETWFTSYAYSFISGIESYFGRGVSQLFENYQLQCQNILDAVAVRQIHNLRDKSLSSYAAIKAQIEAGGTDLSEQLQEGQNNLAYLRNHLMNRIASVQADLDKEELGIDTFKAGLEEAYNNVLNNALLEMAEFKERFNSLFGDIATQVEAIHLNDISDSINGVFDTLNGFIAELNLDQFREAVIDPLNTVRDTVQSIKDQVLYVVVDVTNLLTEFRNTIQGLAEELGDFDEEGQFHYAFESTLNDLFDQMNGNLNDTVRPAIEQFGNDTIGGVFEQLETILTPAVDAVEGVRNDLGDLLQGFLDLLGTLNVTDALETAQTKLDEMLDNLGSIEFDPITAPVIEEIEAMEEHLREIDVSSLSELTRGVLQVSVEVFTAIDFDAQIKDLLMEGMDTIVDYPKEAMDELIEQVEVVKDKVDAVSPSIILTPLSDLYEPVRTGLEAISVEQIAAPLTDWHTALQEQLDQFAPAQLLQPLIDSYEEVLANFDQFNPAQLIEPIQSAVDEAVSFFDNIDLSTVTAPLTEGIQTIQENIANLNPANLLDPLIEGFEAIQEQMDQYNPAVLLAPVDSIVDSILDTVTDLSEDLLAILQDALVSFSDRIERISPTHIFERLNTDCDYLHGLLEQLNPQQIVADLHGPYMEMKSAYQGAGMGTPETDALVEALNPLTVLSELSTDFQALEDTWQSWHDGFEAGDLGALHDTLRPQLESFLPLADAGELTFDFITTFLQENKPSSFLGGLTTLYETLQEQLNALNPQQIKNNLQGTFDEIESVFSQLDISDIVQEVDTLFDDIKGIVTDIDLQVIADELDNLMSDVQSVLASLDPGVLTAPLEELWNNVIGVLDDIDPQGLLAPLTDVIDPIKEAVLAFDPETFAESLNLLFDEIKGIIDEIDVRIVLQPLTDKLDELRDEMDEELTKVGQAFEDMVRAVPV